MTKRYSIKFYKAIGDSHSIGWQIIDNSNNSLPIDWHPNKNAAAAECKVLNNKDKPKELTLYNVKKLSGYYADSITQNKEGEFIFRKVFGKHRTSPFFFDEKSFANRIMSILSEETEKRVCWKEIDMILKLSEGKTVATQSHYYVRLNIQ